MYDYNGDVNTLLGSFTAPESGKYNINVTNNGNEDLCCHFLNEDLAEVGRTSLICKNGSEQFSNWNLEKGKKYYFYISPWMDYLIHIALSIIYFYHLLFIMCSLMNRLESL